MTSDPDMTRGFDLTSEPWIPVMFTDGSAEEISLSEAFERANDIRTLSGDIPQQVLPIVRLMVAVLYRAYYFAPDSDDEMIGMWKDIWDQGHFDYDVIKHYLRSDEGVFDLFDEERPFFQVRHLEFESKDGDPVSELMADVPKPKKFLFSTRDKDHLASISYPEAARWLIFSQSYDCAGTKSPVKGNTYSKKGKVYAPKDAVGTGLLGAEGGLFLEGDTLFKTLMLNWVLFDPQRSKDSQLFGNDLDRASWERDDFGPDLRLADPCEPEGPVALFTWQARRMRLLRDGGGSRVTGLVSCYGDITTLVDKQDVETMTSWRESERQQKKLGTSHLPLMPRTHDSTRQLWRGLASLLVAGQTESGVDLRPGVIRWVDLLLDRQAIDDKDLLISLHAQGMEYGTQNSVFSNAVDDIFSFPVSMLSYGSLECVKAIEVVEQTENAVTEFARFVLRTSEAAGRMANKKERRIAQNAVRTRAYAKLDPLFKERIAHFSSDEDAILYCNDWRDEVHLELISMAKAHLASSCSSLFKAHGDETVGKAYFGFVSNLNRLLGVANSRDHRRSSIESNDIADAKEE